MNFTAGNITLLIIAHLLLSLIIFSAILSILVFSIRKYMRRFKHVDLNIFDRLQKFVSPAMNRFMLFITFLGKHQFLIPANLFLIGYFAFVPHRNWYSIRVAAIAISSLVLMFLLKHLFRRKRPLSPLLKAAKGLSFPSGHAIMAVTFFGLLIYCTSYAEWSYVERLIVIIFLLILIILIGFSRIYLRVHYPSDVAAGFIIGTIWLLISLASIRGIEELTHPSSDITIDRHVSIKS